MSRSGRAVRSRRAGPGELSRSGVAAGAQCDSDSDLDLGVSAGGITGRGRAPRLGADAQLAGAPGDSARPPAPRLAAVETAARQQGAP